MAEQKTEIDYIPVKAEDIIGERRALYDAFVKSIPFAVAVTAAVLVGIYVFWG